MLTLLSLWQVHVKLELLRADCEQPVGVVICTIIACVLCSDSSG